MAGMVRRSRVQAQPMTGVALRNDAASTRCVPVEATAAAPAFPSRVMESVR